MITANRRSEEGARLKRILEMQRNPVISLPRDDLQREDDGDSDDREKSLAELVFDGHCCV